MIIKPISTEKVIRMVELDNVIAFEVGYKDSKGLIKKEVEKMFKVKVESVNTLTRKNKKIAYIKLDKKNPAIDVATKLGMI
jgi:large subunit ribosomal protein L23